MNTLIQCLLTCTAALLLSACGGPETEPVPEPKAQEAPANTAQPVPLHPLPRPAGELPPAGKDTAPAPQAPANPGD
jgi:hypothetical protein